MAEKKTAAKKAPAAKAETAPKAAAPKAAAPKAEKAAKKPAAKKAPEQVIKTILQVGGKDFDVSTLAADALKNFKSVHKRKVVNEFVLYVKPEENAAYYTVNGEGAEDYKIDL